MREIRTALKEGVHIQVLARKYRVSDSTIRDIKVGRTWKDIK